MRSSSAPGYKFFCAPRGTILAGGHSSSASAMCRHRKTGSGQERGTKKGLKGLHVLVRVSLWILCSLEGINKTILPPWALPPGVRRSAGRCADGWFMPCCGRLVLSRRSQLGILLPPCPPVPSQCSFRTRTGCTVTVWSWECAFLCALFLPKMFQKRVFFSVIISYGQTVWLSILR